MAACLYFKANGAAFLDSGISPENCTNYIVLQKDEYLHYQAMYSTSIAPFDYVTAASIFSFFFSFIVGVWYVSKNIGLVLSAVRRF